MPLRIRSVTESDVPALLSIYAPYVEQTAITFEYTVPTPSAFDARRRAVQAFYPYLAAEQNGELLGYVYASRFREREAYAFNVETSLYVRQDCRRQGLGTRLYDALETALRAQGVLNMNASIAAPAGSEDETATLDSLHFHSARGFRTVGVFTNSGYKFNRWYNMVWMEKMLGAHTASPHPLIPYCQTGGAGQTV